MMILSVDNDKDDDNEMIKTGKYVINIAFIIILMIKNEKKKTKMARMMLIMTNLKGLVAFQTFVSCTVVDVGQEHRVHLQRSHIKIKLDLYDL